MNPGAIIVLQPRILNPENKDQLEFMLSVYLNWAQKEGYAVEFLSEPYDECSSYVFAVYGKDVFSKLKPETGTHRFSQRSPYDERKNIHTTFVETSVYETIPDEECAFEANEISFEILKSGEKGGQVVGVTQHPIQAKHLSSGLKAIAYGGKSQLKTREYAHVLLACKLKYNDFLRPREFNVVRNYRLDPYVQIFDLRTGYVAHDISSLAAGQFECFNTIQKENEHENSSRRRTSNKA